MESVSNFEDYIRKPAEFGKSEDHGESHANCVNLEENTGRCLDKMENGIEDRSHKNFEDYIRKPAEFNKGDENKIIENNTTVENCIRKPGKWEKTEGEEANNEGNSSIFSGDENFDDYSRQPEKWANKTNSNGTSAETTYLADRSTVKNESNPKIDDKIIFPDKEMLRESKEDKLKNKEFEGKKDDRIVFPDE